MVKRAGLPREWEDIAASVVLDRDVAFFDIDIRRSVFAHRSQLDQVAIRLEFLQREKQIESAHHIVNLSSDGMFAIDHREGRRALLSEMNHSLRLEILYESGHEFIICEVSRIEFDRTSRGLLPRAQTLGHGRNRRQGLHAEFVVPLAATEIIDDR